MLKRVWSKGNTKPLLVRVQKCTASLKISVTVLQEHERERGREKGGVIGKNLLKYFIELPIV